MADPRIAFLDLEATGLQGVPIEVGFAVLLPSEAIHVESRLVWATDAEWQANVRLTWDANAAAMHGITIEELERLGEEPASIAAWLNESLGGLDVMVSSPFDRQWIGEIFAEAGRPPAGPTDRSFIVKAIEASLPQFAGAGRRHRAGPDAEHMARAWLAFRQKQGQQ